MKAIMKMRAEFGALEIADVPKPEISFEDEVLVRVHSAAVCGSDIHAYEYIPSYRSFMTIPVVLGHEACGIVESTGKNVTQFKPGDKVMGESNIYCGKCRNCRTGFTNICDYNLMRGLTTTGVMQEYVVFNEKNLHHVPDDLSFDEGAAAQACTVSTHGVLHRININPGDAVVVMGVGIIGMAAAQLARLKGGNVLLSGTDEDEAIRLPIAKKLGFQTINCQKENVATASAEFFGRKADFVLECSGASSAIVSASDVVRKGGTILLLGLVGKDVPFPFAKLIRAEVNLISSYTSTWIDYEETLELMRTGALDIKPFLSVYTVDKGVSAFEDAYGKKVLKPVVRFA